MNLRVDLIQVAERRSASLVSLSLFLRILTFTVISALVFVILVFGKHMRDVNEHLHWVNTSIKKIKPQYDEQIALTTNLNRQKDVLTEFQGWKSARLPVYEQLKAIQVLVPPTIQLTELRIDRVVQTVDKKTARVFKIQIKGRATSARADAEVDKFRQDLLKDPTLQPYLQEIAIPPGSFRQDPDPKAAKTDRLFELVCKYKPLKFE
jgi:flagellar basal body-associated protein FliL